MIISTTIYGFTDFFGEGSTLTNIAGLWLVPKLPRWVPTGDIWVWYVADSRPAWRSLSFGSPLSTPPLVGTLTLDLFSDDGEDFIDRGECDTEWGDWGIVVNRGGSDCESTYKIYKYTRNKSHVWRKKINKKVIYCHLPRHIQTEYIDDPKIKHFACEGDFPRSG